MNSVSRSATAVLLLILGLTGRVWAQDPKNDSVFVTAKALEPTQPAKAIQEYQKIKGDYDRKNPEIAAEALLRAAQFAADPNRFVKSGAFQSDGKTPVKAQLLQEYSDQQADGERQAHDAIKQLLQQYPTSNAAKIANEPHYANVYTSVQALTEYNNGETVGVAGDLQHRVSVADARNEPAQVANPTMTFKDALEDRIDRRNSKALGYQIINRIVGMTGANPAFSYWFALILIAVVVKGITLPLTLKTYKSQREMQRIQPQLKVINDKYKGKPEYQEKVMAVYKEHGINPLASCFPMLVQFPFLILVYNTIRAYEFHFVNGKFLWIGSSLSHQFPGIVASNLAQFDIPLLVLYAASNYVTMKLTPAQDPQMAQQQKSMAVMMTFVMFWMFMTYKWSAAFILYWLVLNIISAWQQYTFIFKPNRMNPIVAIESSGVVAETDSSEARALKRAPAGTPRPATATTPIPGGEQMRPRPKRNRKK